MPDFDHEDETTFWREQRTSPHQPPPADIDAMRLEAGTIICPYCQAPIDADCRNGLTSAPFRYLPCHPIRLTAARKATEARAA